MVTERASKNSFGQKALLELERNRAADFKELMYYLEGDNKKAVKKALKKHGIKKLPEKWNDKNYTTYEISQMKDIAELKYVK